MIMPHSYSCPDVQCFKLLLAPTGVLALVDHCRCLRELSVSYTLLSDDLLNALSSERHVCLEVRFRRATTKHSGSACLCEWLSPQ